MVLLYPITLVIKVIIKDRAIYLKIVFIQLGNLFRIKKKELLLLIELVPVPSKLLLSAMFTKTFVPPVVTLLMANKAPVIKGAPIIINNATSLARVLRPGVMVCIKLPLYADLRYKLTMVLYRINEVRKEPVTCTLTFSLIICSKGLSITSIPLLINSFIVISPAIPKGLFWTKLIVSVAELTSDTIVFFYFLVLIYYNLVSLGKVKVYLPFPLEGL